MNYFIINATELNGKPGVRQFFSREEAIQEFLLIQKLSLRNFSKISKDENQFVASNIFGILSHRGQIIS